MVAQIHALEEQSNKQAATVAAATATATTVTTASSPPAATAAAGLSLVTEGTLRDQPLRAGSPYYYTRPCVIYTYPCVFVVLAWLPLYS